MKKLQFRAEGTPVPVGSFIPMKRKDGSLYVLRQNSAGAKAWKRAVLAAAINAKNLQKWPKQNTNANYTVSLSFLLPKPKTVKRSAPTVKPDIDKLCRGTLDALTQAGVIDDDARVCQLIACKTYAMDGEQPGAIITIINKNERETA